MRQMAIPYHALARHDKHQCPQVLCQYQNFLPVVLIKNENALCDNFFNYCQRQLGENSPIHYIKQVKSSILS